jgi:hypothetical protein
VLFRSGLIFSFTKKVWELLFISVPIASARRSCWCARLAFTYLAPALELHGLHTGLRLLMSSGPPASKGMMWSASVAGALWQSTHVMGPLLNSSFRALLNSGVDRRVMLVRFFSDALGCACGCLHVNHGVSAVIAPHSSTYQVWLPDDYTSGRTPLTFVTFGRCTGRSMTACSTLVPECYAY